MAHFNPFILSAKFKLAHNVYAFICILKKEISLSPPGGWYVCDNEAWALDPSPGTLMGSAFLRFWDHIELDFPHLLQLFLKFLLCHYGL